MSGASGKIPAAIHVSPEAYVGGALARVQEGDIIRVDGVKLFADAVLEGNPLTDPPTLPGAAVLGGFGLSSNRPLDAVEAAISESSTPDEVAG